MRRGDNRVTAAPKIFCQGWLTAVALAMVPASRCPATRVTTSCGTASMSAPPAGPWDPRLKRRASPGAAQHVGCALHVGGPSFGHTLSDASKSSSTAERDQAVLGPSGSCSGGPSAGPPPSASHMYTSELQVPCDRLLAVGSASVAVDHGTIPGDIGVSSIFFDVQALAAGFSDQRLLAQSPMARALRMS